MTSPTTPRTILGTDYILSALAAEGLGHLFMVPGGLVDPFLPALARQKKLTPVIAAHEGGAVYMGAGPARRRRRAGRGAGGGRPGRPKQGTRRCRRQDRRLASAGDDRRGAARHGRSRRVSRREPSDTRRHRRHGSAHA